MVLLNLQNQFPHSYYGVGRFVDGTIWVTMVRTLDIRTGVPSNIHLWSYKHLTYKIPLWIVLQRIEDLSYFVFHVSGDCVSSICAALQR